MEESWFEALHDEFEKPYFLLLKDFLKVEKNKFPIFPPGSQIFNAFQFTPLPSVKVVILGQDPYHGPGQAHGLCFSVPDGIQPPPSLVNIFKEIEADLKIKSPTSGNLEKWAKQGVLLLNATLTVRSGQAGSHQGKGWEIFTDKVIETISELRAGVVFLLWGKYAQAKTSLIDKTKHFILTSSHPSPLSVYRGFSGCKHFSQTNRILQQHGLEAIDWNLEN
ncbi:MAG TPA: uracil-DNA glycosylase [Bacteroidales bacterium]